MNLTRSAQQRMIRQLEIHVNRLSSLGDDPKGCHTLAAVHLIFNSISVSFLGPFTSVVEKHMNWSSQAGCPTHCQEDTVTHILVISETTAEAQASNYYSHISGADWPDLIFQSISTCSACLFVLNECGTFVKNMPMTQNSGRCECELACSAADSSLSEGEFSSFFVAISWPPLSLEPLPALGCSVSWSRGEKPNQTSSSQPFLSLRLWI